MRARRVVVWGIFGGLIAALCGCREGEATPRGDVVDTPVGTTPAEAMGRWQVQARPSPELDRVRVQMCFEGWVPPRLEAQNPLVGAALRDVVHVPVAGDTAPEVLAVDGGAVALTGLQVGDCAAYTVDLASMLASAAIGVPGRMRMRAFRYGSDLMLSPDYWLLRPAEPDGDRPAPHMQGSFELPPGLRALVPWPLVEGGDRERGPFDIPRTTFAWRIHGAMGRFDVDELDVGASHLRVAALGDGWGVERARLLAWIEASARAVAGLYQGFPVPSAQVILVPVSGRQVVFGNAAQGGGAGVAIMVGTEVTAEALAEDWVAVHELLHLGMPMVEDAGDWLSEGLATYYQPVVQARAGAMSARAAWERLHDGFGRGRSRSSGRTLRAESRDMGETHQYWRVYWAGAAIALIADVEMRTRGGSLDQQVRAIRACCLDAPYTWSVDGLLARVSAPERGPGLAETAARYLDLREFPDLAETYRALGLGFDDAGRLVEVSDDEAARRLRVAIMGSEAVPRPPAEG
ncbi:hypothetical protein [Haliangium sp.]|uniref:hypothetical protein n=1 Tax=Haliangium sp. TaxID=2663208 RepID=UPI003D097088